MPTHVGRSSEDAVAAVDAEHVAGVERGLAARQIDGGTVPVRRVAPPLERDAGQDPLGDLGPLQPGVELRRARPAGQQRVSADAVLAELDGQRLGERDDAGLRRAVRRITGCAEARRDAGRADQAAALSLFDQLPGSPAQALLGERATPESPTPSRRCTTPASRTTRNQSPRS